MSTGEALEGRKQIIQPCGETKEMYWRSYAAAVVGETVMAGDVTQETGEGGPIPSKEGATVTERLGGDHVLQQREGANMMERLGGDRVLQQMEILLRNNQEITLIKDILLSLQKDVTKQVL